MFIDAVDEADATGPLAEFYAQQRASWGFLPNYAGAFSSRPEVGAAWAHLNVAIRDGMERRRYEIATIAAARQLRSTYCTVAHSTFLRDVCGDEEAMRATATDPSALAPVDRAVYEFATKVARDASSVTQADCDGLQALGLSDADIADVVYAVAARAFFTTILDGLGAECDPETAGKLDPELRATMVVGRPIAGT